MDAAISPFLERKMLDFGSQASFQLTLYSNSDTAVSILVQGFTKSGSFIFHYTTTGGATLDTNVFGLTDIPIYLTIASLANGLHNGQCYVAAQLNIEGTDIIQLCAGYLTTLKNLTWPQQIAEDYLSGKGNLIQDASANPAANTEISYIIPQGTFAKLQAISFSFVTDASAANRVVSLRIFGGGIGDLTLNPPAVQPASKTYTYNYGVGLPHHFETTSLNMNIPLPPDLILDDGVTIATVTTNRQATDNFGAATIGMEQWRQAD